ncbi:DUF2835 family protein [Neptunicella sp. SCSIO 80796]|uniref:DUF2835 family protein n=1 Tax=Neptunicella plasticusilytica TaxID=3117012 RepID=UPI003A4D7088
MKSYFFQIDLPYKHCVNLYTPGVNTVVIPAESGEKVKLPSVNLRPFVQQRGIHGRFRLIVDDNNKVKSFEKIT